MNKKVAILSSSFPPNMKGGISSAHYNLFEGLQKSGVSVKVFTFDEWEYRKFSNYLVVRTGTPEKIKKIINGVYFLLNKIFPRLGKKYNWHSLDILLCLCGSYLMNIEIEKFKPDIIIMGDHGCPGYFLKKKKNQKYVWISHHNPARFIDVPFILKSYKDDVRFAIKFENKILKNVDKIICPSLYMYEEFKKTYCFDVNRQKIAILPNIVDEILIDSIPVSDFIKKNNFSKDSIAIYIPAAGSLFKGSRFICEIMRRLSNLTNKKIVFYLSGEIQEEQKEEFNYMPANASVFIPGYLEYQENIANVKRCNFAISPTLVDSFGMAILEANFSGLPVVTFDVGGNRDIIVNNENGFLIDFMNIENLVNKAALLVNDEEICSKMSEKAMKLAKDKFSCGEIIDSYMRFISS